MHNLQTVIPLFLILFICTLDGYSMMNYRLPAKRAYSCFAVVAVMCLIVNSYISITYGNHVLRNMIIFTIGMPYFALILLITKDSISKTVFNFWFWINIYEIITNFSAFVNDFTLCNYYFYTALRFILFLGYFILYNYHVKEKHKKLMDMLDVNWWIFSFIPMFFTVLICLVNYYFGDFHGHTRNYPVLFIIHTLMLLVYVLIFYTFKTAYDAMEEQRLTQSLKEQIGLQKKQYEFYLQKAESERIFRHDARHRDTILLSCLENGDTGRAKALLNKELTEVQPNMQVCENILINAVLMQYRTKAKEKDLKFSMQIQMPERLCCDEAEFCVMLSNLLENSLEAADTYIQVEIKYLNCQLSINIKNNYTTELIRDANGGYLTTKQHGMGLGLKSVNAILKKNGGFMRIDDTNGVFNVFATLKN